MCGITGFIDFTQQKDLKDLVCLTDTIKHRGPDDSGQEVFRTPQATIGLGQRRLSIIDLSPLGHQPMFSADKSICLVFNGEIYNFQEIQRELSGLGHKFVSHSDTEVIIKAYQQWGVEVSVKKFIGMFAYVLYDRTKGTIYLVRDRVGVKPLYYYYQAELFLFSSELKSFSSFPEFKRNIAPSAVASYFQSGYITGEQTIFNAAYRVPPGHYLELNLADKTLRKQEYWNVLNYYAQPKLDLSLAEILAETEKLLLSAFQYRMIADVPVGVFLSGGYDSSLVTALLQKNNTQKIKTFTIGFNDPKYNEAQYAREVAERLGTEHYEHYCSPQDALDILPQLASIYDEPYGDSSAIPTVLLSRFVKQHVKVALSADGGDEIFAGYPVYSYTHKLFAKFSAIPRPLRKLVSSTLAKAPLDSSKWQKLVQLLEQQEPLEAYKTLTTNFLNRQLKALLLDKDTKPDLVLSELTSQDHMIQHFMAYSYHTYLPDDIMVKVDRAAMSVGLEGREPFLDQRIIEFMARVPLEYKLHNGQLKHILRAITHKYLPAELMDRKKQGFSIPINSWLHQELKPLLLDYLNFDRVKREGLLDPHEVVRLRDAFLSKNTVNPHNIWLLLLFELWYERWMK